MPLSRALAPQNAARAAILYAVAIAYLSLIPFDFRPFPLEDAWRIFRQVPNLKLGILNRADWVANLLAYIPLGFLVTAALPGRGFRARPWAALAAVAVCALPIFAIEFTQLFFAPRTVSQNDLIAELLGAGIGAAAWFPLRNRLDRWAEGLARGGDHARTAVLSAYAVAYLGLSLFPFDFIVSASELAWKIRQGSYGWILAPGHCSAFLPCAVRLGVEALACAPLGWLWATWRRKRGGTGTGALGALAVGALLGLGIEAAQFLIASGVSQGASVATRAAGVLAGALASGAFRTVDQVTLVRWGRVLTWALALPYLVVIAFAAGWPGSGPLPISAVLARLPEFKLLPFYYHYYVPEAHAMMSALAHLALYAPVGVAAWLWRGQSANGARPGVLVAITLAVVAEASKAFLPGKHPDFTNALIAGTSAWLAFHALRLASQRARPSTPAASRGDLAPAASTVAEPTAQGEFAAVLAWRSAAVLLAAIVLVSLAGFPVYRAALAAGLMAYALLLFHRPGAWVYAVPALLPVLDLTLLSGRFFWDEFDLLLAVTLGVRLATHRPTSAGGGSSGLPRVALFLLAACSLISAAIGLWPLAPLDANAFTNYHSHYNALRPLKAVAWAFALLALLLWDRAEGRDPARGVASGMAVGGVLAALAVAWERWLFPGLFDFSAHFRAGGTFSAIHTGGGYVESYLVASFPFVLMGVLRPSRALPRVAWLGAGVLICYAVLVTYSRGGIAGLAVAGLLTVAFALWARRSIRRSAFAPAPGLRWALATVFVLALVAAVPIFAGAYLGARFSNARADLDGRTSHWMAVLRAVTPGPTTAVFGMGLGRIAEATFWARPAEPPPASYRLAREPGPRGQFLQLGGGKGLYFDQRVPVEPGQRYTLAFEARSEQPGTLLTIALCEKSLLESARCKSATTRVTRAWGRYSVGIDSPTPAEPGLRFARPVTLSVHNGTSLTVIDVDRVSLVDARGAELVRNGDFAHDTDQWYFTSDDHFAWHAFNALVHVFLEWGALGVIAFGLLLWSAARVLIVHARTEPVAGALAAAIAGLLIIGLFDSVVDAPRHLLLFLLLLLVAFFVVPQRPASPHPLERNR